MTATAHKMPEGIRRVEKGVYRSTDDRWEIRQEPRGWVLRQLEDGLAFRESAAEWQTRGEVAGLLPHPNLGEAWTEIEGVQAPSPSPETPTATDVKATFERLEDGKGRELTVKQPSTNADGTCTGSLAQTSHTGSRGYKVACKVCGREVAPRKNGVLNIHKPQQ